MSYVALTASDDFRDFVRNLDTTGREADFASLDDYIIAWLADGRGVTETGGDYHAFLQAVVLITALWGEDRDHFLQYNSGERYYERRIDKAFDPGVLGSDMVCIQPGVYQRYVFHYGPCHPSRHDRD